jgi:beta-lactamase regulating signal transducer with metallopeptidase domain/protocatechuate 3,4-dioxygenase beta subunit
MTGEIFSAESFLWKCLWQSTIFLVVGLLGSFLFRRQSARAHRVLFLAMMASVIVPAASILVKHYELGLFVAEPAVIQPPTEGRAKYEVTGIISNEATEQSTTTINEDLHTVTAVSEAAKFPWRSAMLYAWITASLILTARLLVTFVLGVRLLRRAVPLDCGKIEEAIDKAKTKLGISKDVMIYVSAKICSPVIWCWRRTPVLLVPSAAGRLDNGVDWAGVLCHELAHYKRRDHVAGLLAELTVCLLPWQLLLWWAKSRLISLSEQACDDWVVASGQLGTDYAESLLNLIPEGQMAFVPAVVSSKRGLAGRVRRILKDSCGNPRTGAAWALAVCIIGTCLAVGVAFAQTRPAKPKSAMEREEKPATSPHQVVNDSLIKVTGLVKDPDGRPVSGTSVTLFQTKLEYETNAEGKFTAVLPPSDKMRFFFAVHKQRKLVASGRLAGGKQHLEINLVPAKMVSGRVVDPNGMPVGGAQVAPLHATCFHVLTDNEGRFDVGWSPEWAGDLKYFFLMARHQELDLATIVEITESAEVANIELEPGLTLTGTIKDPNGMPIPKARVGLILHTQASAPGYGCGTPVEDVLTDDKGHYELKALPQKQDWIIHASADGYWQNKIETGIINRTTDREEIDTIILKKPILSVSGIVVDVDGMAVANIPVYLWGDGQPDLASETDTQGKFSFDKVCRGSINICAKNKTLFGIIETQGGAKDISIVASPRLAPKPDNTDDSNS